MYYLRLPHPDGSVYDVVGSSPEALIKVTGRQAITHPIAGSRPRGKTPEQDVEHADDLAADLKERAEHLMLVDLSRNDLQRVCRAGTVDTVEFMTIRRYSHIMHLESTVVGQLREEATAYDVLVATFPAGTLSGAPKPRAMALIDEFEGLRRGLYGGVGGYVGFSRDMGLFLIHILRCRRAGSWGTRGGRGPFKKKQSIELNEHHPRNTHESTLHAHHTAREHVTR